MKTWKNLKHPLAVSKIDNSYLTKLSFVNWVNWPKNLPNKHYTCGAHGFWVMSQNSVLLIEFGKIQTTLKNLSYSDENWKHIWDVFKWLKTEFNGKVVKK